MKKIGLLSDTHGTLLPRVSAFFEQCDEIWHAGDIGNPETLQNLENLKPLRAVYGNIDDTKTRSACKETAIFKCEDLVVAMVHIGGYPGRYTPLARKLILESKPGLFISGHSHILKVIYDNKHQLLHINPGAAGISGLHKVITAVRFKVEKDRITDLEILEIDRKKQI
ncbi:MAG: metallophosphoesterase family protein [Bacteroidales bacterium]|nr:metallophosphoesterase family protein [Bacteroidales bacterium]